MILLPPELFDKILKKRFKPTISFERASSFTLSLTMLNPDTPILKNSVDPDQLGFEDPHFFSAQIANT